MIWLTSIAGLLAGGVACNILRLGDMPLWRYVTGFYLIILGNDLLRSALDAAMAWAKSIQ